MGIDPRHGRHNNTPRISADRRCQRIDFYRENNRRHSSWKPRISDTNMRRSYDRSNEGSKRYRFQVPRFGGCCEMDASEIMSEIDCLELETEIQTRLLYSWNQMATSGMNFGVDLSYKSRQDFDTVWWLAWDQRLSTLHHWLRKVGVWLASFVCSKRVIRMINPSYFWYITLSAVRRININSISWQGHD